jgi:hypothetical protein
MLKPVLVLLSTIRSGYVAKTFETAWQCGHDSQGWRSRETACRMIAESLCLQEVSELASGSVNESGAVSELAE